MLMRMREKWVSMSSDSDEEEYPRAPAQKARDENILGVFESTVDPVLTTSEVAEELPIGKRATLNRLEDLVERGEIESKDVGVGRVWWRAEPAVSPVDDPEPAKRAPAERQTEEEPEPASADTADSTAEADAPVDEMESESPGWSFIGSVGRHSIFAGLFLLGLLLAESSTAQTLLPIGVSRLFLTSFVFFLIGFPTWAAFKSKQFFEQRNGTLTQFFRSLPPRSDSEA